MKLTLTRESLIKAVKVARELLDNRPTIPALGQVLINTAIEGAVAELSATDLECWYRARLSDGAVADGAGQIAIGGRRLLDALAAADVAGEVEIETLSSDAARLRVGGTTYKFPLFDVRSLPQAPEMFPRKSAEQFDEAAASGIVFDSKVMAKCLDVTLPFVSPDESRYNLSGVYLEAPTKGTARLIATDGHRLGVIDRPAPEFELAHGVILPRKALAAARKLLSRDEVVRLAVDGTLARITIGDADFTMRLIEGEFPDYRGVIPKSSKLNMKVNRAEMKAAVARVAVMASERYRGVKLEFARELLTISATDPGFGGEASASVPTTYAGTEGISIGMNAGYLMQALDAFDPLEVVDLGVSDDVSPLVLRGEDIATVVMPMRL